MGPNISWYLGNLGKEGKKLAKSLPAGYQKVTFVIIVGPIRYMYPIFTYHKNQPNVGKYTIHGSLGFVIIDIIILGILTTRPRHLPQFYRTPSFEFFFGGARHSLGKYLFIYLFFWGGGAVADVNVEESNSGPPKKVLRPPKGTSAFFWFVKF